MKILMGVLLGILIMTGVMWSFSQMENKHAAEIGHLYQSRSSDDLYQEKIAALNKRLDDILIFGGIIVTLLLAINAGIFVNAERQVESYMQKNFQHYYDQMKTILGKAEKMFEETENKLNG